MASVNMVSGTNYINDNAVAITVIFDCDFGTGTASLQLKSAGASAFKTIKTFTADEVVEALIPQGAEYKATLTGDSEIVATFDY